MGIHVRIAGGLWALIGAGLTTFTGWIMVIFWREPRGRDFGILIPYMFFPFGVASLIFGTGLLTGRQISRAGATVLALLLILPSVPHLLLSRMVVVFGFFPTPLLILQGIYTLWIIHSKASQEWLRLHHVAKPRYPLISAMATVLILAIWTGATNTRATQLNRSTLEAEPPRVAIPSLGLARIDQRGFASEIENGEPVGVILDPMISDSVYAYVTFTVPPTRAGLRVPYTWKWSAPSGEMIQDEGVYVTKDKTDFLTLTVWQQILPTDQKIAQPSGTWRVEFTIDGISLAKLELDARR